MRPHPHELLVVSSFVVIIDWPMDRVQRQWAVAHGYGPWIQLIWHCCAGVAAFEVEIHDLGVSKEPSTE